MSVSLKSWVKIDRALEQPYRIFHFLMRNVTSVKRQGEGVVIVKLFGMGSIIRLLDICEETGVDPPDLTIVTTDSHKELCALWGLKAVYINTSSLLALFTSCLSAIAVVGRIRPAMIVDFERCSNLVGIFRTTMAWWARARTLSFERRSLASTQSIVHHIDNLTQEQIFRTGIEQFVKNRKERTVTEVAISGGKVIVNINASDLLEIRRYDLKSFALVIKTIHSKNPGTRFYFSGVKSERAYVQTLVEALAGIPAHNVAGDWTLARLIAELSDCHLLITGDSAPLHLARYMNVTTLSIWGPTQPAHFGYEPGANFRIASLRMPCSPCFLHPHSKAAMECNGAITCMRQLNAGNIAAVALDLLSNYRQSREVFVPVNFRVHAPHPLDVLG